MSSLSNSHHKCRHHFNLQRIAERKAKKAAAAEAARDAASRPPPSTASKIVDKFVTPLGWTLVLGFATTFGGLIASYVWGRYVTGSILPGQWVPQPDHIKQTTTTNAQTGTTVVVTDTDIPHQPTQSDALALESASVVTSGIATGEVPTQSRRE